MKPGRFPGCTPPEDEPVDADAPDAAEDASPAVPTDPLFDGLEGQALDERRAFVDELRADGVPDEELEAAARAARLPLLPVQRVLQGTPTLRTADLVARTGVDPELLERVLQAAGVALPAHREAAWEERDLALPRLIAALSGLGIDDEALVELARTLGETSARVGAAAIIGLGSGLTREGDTERELSARLAAATVPVNDHLADTLGVLVRTLTLDQLTAIELDAEQIADGRVAGATPIAIGFADVVGFTRMGEQLGAQRLRDVAKRLGELGAEVSVGGVRVVKTIGDAVMLAGPRPAAVVESMLALQEGVLAEDFPRIRAGVATGDAVPRAGDWFGPPVNRAARACAAARPETVLADDLTRERATQDGLAWSTIGRVHLKGMGRVRLHRVRRATR
ncbi:adenylate/guanylate cyclase domain-containing protein [Patulibacter minatonensis]|uniref:adenylate/guanylate cyclase domain-containing protein n=1 Tax=Patulibacter minatonensis TaxID=298163 RepID=UPI000478AFF9|nr:adenylate/guanylate cyclase domain-containing protein [Patulibacter minatonensis]